MAEILWHRRETRRQTENTNVCLNDGKAPAYSPITFLMIPSSQEKGAKEENENRDRPRFLPLRHSGREAGIPFRDTNLAAGTSPTRNTHSSPMSPISRENLVCPRF